MKLKRKIKFCGLQCFILRRQSGRPLFVSVRLVLAGPADFDLLLKLARSKVFQNRNNYNIAAHLGHRRERRIAIWLAAGREQNKHVPTEHERTHLLIYKYWSSYCRNACDSGDPRCKSFLDERPWAWDFIKDFLCTTYDIQHGNVICVMGWTHG